MDFGSVDSANQQSSDDREFEVNLMPEQSECVPVGISDGTLVRETDVDWAGCDLEGVMDTIAICVKRCPRPPWPRVGPSHGCLCRYQSSLPLLNQLQALLIQCHYSRRGYASSEGNHQKGTQECIEHLGIHRTRELRVVFQSNLQGSSARCWTLC